MNNKMNNILKDVCLKYNVPMTPIKNGVSRKAYTPAKKEFCHKAREYNYTLKSIGDFIGLSYCSVCNYLKPEKFTKEDVNYIKSIEIK